MKSLDLMGLNRHAAKSINELDAAVFSGDSFFEIEAIETLENYLARWQRGLNEHRASLLAEACEDI